MERQRQQQEFEEYSRLHSRAEPDHSGEAKFSSEASEKTFSERNEVWAERKKKVGFDLMQSEAVCLAWVY